MPRALMEWLNWWSIAGDFRAISLADGSPVYERSRPEGVVAMIYLDVAQCLYS